MNYFRHTYRSPIGPLHLIASEDQLFAVIYDATMARFAKIFAGADGRETALLLTAARQLDEYFAGRRQSFALPLKLSGTDFQKKVWLALQEIPFGETRTYLEQATLIHNPRAVRAVGRTNGLNPLSIVLPCHRVVGSNGALTGYAGGLAAKRFLLDLERRKEHLETDEFKPAAHRR